MNVAGKVNLMVFDKTGTLTEGGMDVYGVKGTYDYDIEWPGDLNRETDYQVDYLRRHFLYSLACCHSLVTING
eukprot:CAMPEP_0201283524 /NCGR_PEP_ID=MMETSP1317-20130820/8763_1 /ASSEMBLY_ACC=CAM_ASM_000770 /TAXON_ID=187299 /ORGANISM="Undescribed Undescribed, Strain Undescribed" /LENGTH=72 /DNA_ID=CAMNT_0047600029 /DNA_START=136 /DNA_END=354 /DNA_ORIENTATION=-